MKLSTIPLVPNDATVVERKAAELISAGDARTCSVAAIVAALRTGPKTTRQLAAIATRFGARLYELRQLGYEITTGFKDGTAVYTLVCEGSAIVSNANPLVRLGTPGYTRDYNPDPVRVTETDIAVAESVWREHHAGRTADRLRRIERAGDWGGGALDEMRDAQRERRLPENECPDCGEDVAWEPPHDAEPDNNVPRWDGGYLCGNGHWWECGK